MSYFSKRFLRYETNANSARLDYGEVVNVINDKLINLNMGGTGYILEAVGVDGDYIPKVGDWATVEWRNGQPIAKGGSGISTGLRNINQSVKVISTSELASGVVNASHIRTNTIEARHITAYSIKANHIDANQINANHIQTNSIESKHISANQINSGHISANSIGASHIITDSIQSKHIGTNTIQSNHISANVINGAHINSHSIQSQHISANAVKAEHIDVGVINAQHISANSIEATHIKTNSVQSYHISANQINSQHISANSVQAGHISANTITGEHLSINTVQAKHIVSDSIQSSHISANVVQSKHISSNSIQSNHISANTIEGQHIKAGSIESDHLTVGTKKEGLLGQYYTHDGGSKKFQVYKGSQIDKTINFDWGGGSPAIVGQIDNYAVRWQGFIFAPETGDYTFVVTSDDGKKLHVDNKTIIDQWIPMGTTPHSGNVSLTKDNYYPINLEWFENSGGAVVKLEWIKPSLAREVIPSKYLTQGNTVIDGASIVTGTITASNIQTGTITAESGVIADLAIKSAHIASGSILSAHIANAEIKSAHIVSGNITNAHIANATIEAAKIKSVNADTINSGTINTGLINAGTILGHHISGGTIEGAHIKANQIDSLHIKSGAITATEISAGSVTSDKIQAGSITSDLIQVGSISAEHISTVGLDANNITVYNSTTGETLIGGGYLRVDGLDVGVVQSDNLLGNGLFLAASSAYGLIRDNPMEEAVLGSNVKIAGGHQVWKINLADGAVISKIDIAGKKPVDIAIDEGGTYGYVTVEGDSKLYQIDLFNSAVTNKKLKLGHGPAVVKWVGGNHHLGDHKHLIVLNSDHHDHRVPDSLMVIDAPPHSVGSDLYVHHEIALGNSPYDFAMTSDKKVYVTMSTQGDIAVVDASPSSSMDWKVVNRIPITAYMTDIYHGGLSGTFGLNEAVGGDSSSLYSKESGGGTHNHGGAHSHGGYGTSDGSLKEYEPHGIALSADSETLYVLDHKNDTLVVVDKNGNAPYNSLTGREDTGSPEDSTSGSSADYHGRTRYVRYRIPVGDSPDFIEIVNGKILITLKGSGEIAVIDESEIITAIQNDREFYKTWDNSKAMNTHPTINARHISVGSKVGYMEIDPSVGTKGTLYVSASGQNQIVKIDIDTEKIVSTINTGANPKGMAIKDGYLYIVNHGGTGDLSFVYPHGAYIGDPFLGLEGGIVYQGAQFWTPNRSDWVYDASGNIKSKSTVEFRINEPFLNEGGYSKLSAVGDDYQFSQIEQDIYNVVNYSNGDNTIDVVAEKLSSNLSGNIWFPRHDWLSSPAPSNINVVHQDVSGNIIKNIADSTKYTVYYDNARIEFSGNYVPSGNWVEADYTARHNIYFKPHNGSTLIAVENGSSPNFNTTFEIDEYVPKFVVFDNQQTSSFTPTEDGINETYTGLEYSVYTNRALGITGNTSSAVPLSGNVDMATNGILSTSDYVTLPSGNQYVQVDLGKEYMIGKVNTTHIYDKFRKYRGTKTMVSKDGTSWKTVYDSAVSGEYNEKTWHSDHGHWHYGKTITFGAEPIRYIRDYANGYTDYDSSGNVIGSGNENHWAELSVYGDWELEYGYKYPSNSELAGQQIATNGKGFVSTDIPKAYIAVDIPIEFTTWWYMTYIVGPEFGEIAIEMPTVMGQNHFLPLEAPYVNKIAHRHIMSFPPSTNVKADASRKIKAGKHRAVIKQESGRITLDRLRFEDFQYYNRNSLLIPSNSSSTVFKRYKIVAEQSKWFIGKGRQSTEGAFDSPRKNPDTGLRDYSVPIKYRFRVRAELNADGTKQERGIAYATSAILETGKLSTHWRRSEASDSMPGNRIEHWDGNHPHKTGIQHFHLANGSIRGAKILPNAIMDYHISNYARINEHKLQLNHPTHAHGHYHTDSSGHTHFYDNKDVIDSIHDWAGISGNYGTGNTLARGDHKHDDRYLQLGGGTLKGNLQTDYNITLNPVSTATSSSFYSSRSLRMLSSVWNGTSATNYTGLMEFDAGGGFNFYSNGSGTNTSVLSIDNAGNLHIRGNVDGVDLSAFKSDYDTHVHALATTSGNGFMSSGSVVKLNSIQDNAINQTTTDGRYVQLAGSTVSGTITSTHALPVVSKYAGYKSWALHHPASNRLILAPSKTIDGTDWDWTNEFTFYDNGDIRVTGDIIVTGIIDGVDLSYFKSAYDSHVGSGGDSHALATTSGNGFMSSGNVSKLDGIQSNAINQTTADSRYLQLTGGKITGELEIEGVSPQIELRDTNNTGAGKSYWIHNNDGRLYFLQDTNGNGAWETPYPMIINSDRRVEFAYTPFVKSGTTIYDIFHQGNFDPSTKSDTGHIHSNATTTSNGFMSSGNVAKLDGVQSNAINQTTSDSLYARRDGSNNFAESVVVGSSRQIGATPAEKKRMVIYPAYHTGGPFELWSNDPDGNAYLEWRYGTSKPVVFNHNGSVFKVGGNQVATETWANNSFYTKSSTYTRIETDDKLSTKVDKALDNTLSKTNTFNNTALAIKIQPSTAPTVDTVLFTLNNSSGNSLVTMDAEGDVVINGNLVVNGSTIQKSTQDIQGDMTVSGNLTVSGNSILGNEATDQTTVVGDFRLEGQLKDIGEYKEVHRRPLFGIAGDLQFQTDSIAFEDIGSLNYQGTGHDNPSVKSGATRYYRLYVIYSDDITSTQTTNGQIATLRLYDSVNAVSKDLNLDDTWGDPNARRGWYSPYFKDLPSGHIQLQAKLAQAGNNLGIRWIELIAYDVYES